MYVLILVNDWKEYQQLLGYFCERVCSYFCGKLHPHTPRVGAETRDTSHLRCTET